MASGQGADNYIDVTDFTAGIVRGMRSVQYDTTTDLQAGQAISAGRRAPSPLGAAQELDTWGCVGPPSGGLEPAPRLVEREAQTLWSFSPPNSYFPQDVRIHDIVAFPGYNVVELNPTDGWWSTAQSTRAPDNIAVVHSSFHNNAGQQQYRYTTRLYSAQRDRWTILDDRNILLNVNSNPPLHGGGWATLVQSRRGTGSFLSRLSGSGNVQPDDPFYFMSLVTNQVYMSQIGGNGSPTGRRTMIWPDPTNADAVPRTYGGAAKGSGATDDEYPHVWRHRPFTHQGRLCWTSTHTDHNFFGTFPDRDFSSNFDHFIYFGDDQIRYHDANAIQNAEGQDYLNIDSNEFPAMVSAVESLNSGVLLMVMSNGGGIAVSGALDLNPQITRFPQVQSAGFRNSVQSTMTPFGMVYGTDDGIYAWNGGETAQNLSPQLNGRFWVKPQWSRVDRHSPYTPQGRFAWQAPFLYAPYNWLMDSRSNGWWRLCRPKPEADADPVNSQGIDLGNFTASGTGQVWASPLEQLRNDSFARVLHRFDPTLGATEWSWKSQPFPLGRNRFNVVREVNLTVQAENTGSTIDVTVTGTSGSQTKTLNVDSLNPKLYRLEFNVQCDIDPVIRLRAFSNNVAQSAPKVYRMSVGYREDRSV